MSSPPLPPLDPPLSLPDFDFFSSIPLSLPTPPSSQTHTPLISAPTAQDAQMLALLDLQSLPQELIPRFTHLLTACNTLIQRHGPYSLTNLAHTLAHAQDTQPALQPAGLATTDLHIFHTLWDTTLQVLSTVLSDNTLSLSAFGWGVYGLSSGYVPRSATPVSVATFENHRTRLRAALLELPSLEAEHVSRQRVATPIRPAERVNGLARTNREVHINAWMLVQIMRGAGRWDGVRWFHGVCVAEKWVGALGLD